MCCVFGYEVSESKSWKFEPDVVKWVWFCKSEVLCEVELSECGKWDKNKWGRCQGKGSLCATWEASHSDFLLWNLRLKSCIGNHLSEWPWVSTYASCPLSSARRRKSCEVDGLPFHWLIDNCLKSETWVFRLWQSYYKKKFFEVSLTAFSENYNSIMSW